MFFCYGIAWLLHFKMSPNTTMKAQRLRSGSTVSPEKSSLKLSLGKASSDALRRATYFVTTSIKSRALLRSAVQTYLFPLHITWQKLGSYRIREFRKEKINTLDLYPPPTLPCLRPPGSIWLHVVTPDYSTCIRHNFFIFCPICLKFSRKFLYTYCLILCMKKVENMRKKGGWCIAGAIKSSYQLMTIKNDWFLQCAVIPEWIIIILLSSLKASYLYQ